VNKNKGFTLIELLIVMTVIIILAGIMVPSFRGFQNDAWIVKAQSEITVLQTAVESYYRNHRGRFPEKLENLLEVSPQIVNHLPEDPFKTNGDDYGFELVYSSPGNDVFYVIYSNGPNHVKDWTWDAYAKKVIISGDPDDIFITNARYDIKKKLKKGSLGDNISNTLGN
jgi:prepilin-type N-terminal cleavage/methylation domain-containing protein